MKYYEKEFELSKLTFKFKKIAPTKLLAITSSFSIDDINSSERVFNLVLENTEVKLESKWFPVKEKNSEIYWPQQIEEDLPLLQKIVSKFMNEVIVKVFKNSNE